MVHIYALAVTYLLFLAPASASKSSSTSRRASPDNTGSLLGFDETVANSVSAFSDDDIIPEIKNISPSEFYGHSTSVTRSTSADPYVPAGVEIAETLEKRFLVGTDGRRLTNTAAYPYWSVGRLVWSNGIFCSASLIGPRHILTARHCIIQDAVGTFSPGYDQEDRFGSAKVSVVFSVNGDKKGSSCETRDDFAVMVLSERLGDKLGYFGYKNPDESRFGEPILNNLGYPGDLDGGSRPYGQGGVSAEASLSLQCDSTGPVMCDADTAGGQSGGPLWETGDDGMAYIWGDLSISVSGTITYAGFASGVNLLNAVNNARTDYP